MSPARKPTSKKNAKKSARKKTTKKKPAAASAGKKNVTVPKKGASKPTSKKTGAKSSARKKPAAKTAKKTNRKKTTAKTSGRAKKTTARQAAAAKKPAARPAPKTRPPRRAKLDAKALAAITEQLNEELADLRERQQELEEDSFGDTQSDMTGEVGLDEDFADAGTATFERERDLSLRNNIRDLIDQIERALRRIEDGTYGICERCGQPIDAPRLKALPHALLCMDCKRREERAR